MGNDCVIGPPSGGVSRLNRATVRTLLASAALLAALALAGCDPSDIPTNGRAQAPLSEKTLAEMTSKNMDKESPILVRLFKEESDMEGVAGAALWLLSDLGLSTTGEIVHVDAGFHIMGFREDEAAEA